MHCWLWRLVHKGIDSQRYAKAGFVPSKNIDFESVHFPMLESAVLIYATNMEPGMNTRFAALMMTSLMLLSIGLASAAVPDGDFYATNEDARGIDRNPTSPEVDSTSVTRTYDPVAVNSNVEMTFDSTQVRNSDPAGSGAMFNGAGGAWMVTPGTPTTGPGDTALWSGNSGEKVSYHQGVNVSIADGVSGVDVAVKDVTTDQAFTTTFTNWYSSLDRNQAHGQGTTNNVAKTGVTASGCSTVGSFRMDCSLNGDYNADGTADGIDAVLATDLLIRPAHSGGSANIGYAIHGDGDTASLYFGIDYTFGYNVTVSVDGTTMAEGNTQNIAENSIITVVCSDAKCTQDQVVMTVPVAYNATDFSAANGLDSSRNIYNSTTRLAVYDKTTIKMTFGVDDVNQTEASTSGVLWDPSISLETNEPGMEIGIVKNGELSWCTSKWFLSTCSTSETFDGNTTNGDDGIMLKMTLPLESFYSLAAWGGFDSVELKVNHPNTDQCFTGQIMAHIYNNDEYNAITTKKDLASFLKFGNYYDFGPAGTADSTQSLGSSAAAYCMGSTSGNTNTAFKVDALADFTSDPLLVSYQDGIYDVIERTFEFYAFVHIVGSGTSDSMTIDVESSLPTLTFKHATNYDPLANQNGITRTTNSTNQTNPAFATPYVMHYSGITPTSNVVQGRELSDQSSASASSDFGAEYQGLQSGPFDERKTAQFVPTATTPRSTIECGVAVADGDVVSSEIAIFTNVDTSGHTGANETEWKAYGTLASNSSIWTMGPVDGTNTGTLSVDNKETNAGSSAVSFTGIFINGDNYKAVCTHKVTSYDVGAENLTTQTIVYTTFFSAADDPNYATGGGSDVDDEDDSWLDDLSGWDIIFLAVGLGLILMALYMIFAGNAPAVKDWMSDMRVAMLFFGTGLLFAWAANFYLNTRDSISVETAEFIGFAGYTVMGLGIWYYVRSTSGSMKNWNMAILGGYLILFGIPSAITSFLALDTTLFDDAFWTFPIYDFAAALGTLVGGIAFGTAAANIITGSMD